MFIFSFSGELSGVTSSSSHALSSRGSGTGSLSDLFTLDALSLDFLVKLNFIFPSFTGFILGLVSFGAGLEDLLDSFEVDLDFDFELDAFTGFLLGLDSFGAGLEDLLDSFDVDLGFDFETDALSFLLGA